MTTPDSLKEDVAALTRNCRGFGINPRLVPGVEPVHHAKESHDSCTSGDSSFIVCFRTQPCQAFCLRKIFHQSNANLVVVALDGGDFCSFAVFEDIVLV